MSVNFPAFSQGPGCNKTTLPDVLVGSSHERETMTKQKSILVVAGVLAIGYAIVSTNAFADTSVTPTTTTSTTTTAVVTPAPVAPIAPVAPSAPSGLQDPSATMPNADNNDSDDQADDQSATAAVSDEESVDVSTDVNDDQDGNLTATVDANVSALVGTTSSDGNQGSDNQGDSGSND